MRIVFIGAVEFSLRSLERLCSINAEVVGVCTLQSSALNADHADLSSLCELNGVPWIYADNINAIDTIEWVKQKKPDVIFCFGWSKLLKPELLSLAPLGIVGFHPTALPENRGRHPLIWALVLGLEKTASTFFFMDEDADSGDILSQREVIIEDSDNARSLYDKVTSVALDQIEEFVPKLIAGKITRKKQESLLANNWRKRGLEDGRIDWRMSAQSIRNLVRGLSKPYVGAHFLSEGWEIKVWEVSVVPNAQKNIEPGKVLTYQGAAPVVKCGDGAVLLLNTEPSFHPNVGTYL